MKNFLAVYIGSPTSLAAAKWKALDDAGRKKQELAGMTGWMNWAEKNSSAILNMGSPLGKTKKIDLGGVSDTKNNLTAYTIVQAESHEAAAKLFLNHPHFAIFPGDSIELMECLPIPKM